MYVKYSALLCGLMALVSLATNTLGAVAAHDHGEIAKKVMVPTGGYSLNDQQVL